MMAHDLPPGARRLEPETERALRALLARALREGSHVDELHQVLCRTADEARTKGIHVEQLLVLLKEIWFSLPELAGTSAAETRNELLQELISRCIEQYYRD